ncbi:MAG: DUF58 domain-containing protein [Verrucomicrobiota bacterium]
MNEPSRHQGTRNITGLGVAIGCGAIILLMVGTWIHDGALMTLGFCGLLLIGCGYILAPLNLRDLELKLQLPRRFHAARSVPYVAELWNGRRILDAYQIAVTIRFPQKVERLGYVNWTPVGSGGSLHDRLSIPVRSSFSSVEIEFVSRFPLGLFEVRQTATAAAPTLVYPRLITPLELLSEGAQPDNMPTSGIALGDFLGEPRGVRPYQPGDPANRIHQSATARSLARDQSLQVRAYDPPGFHPYRCHLIFHSQPATGELIRFDRFERGLSLVAGTLNYLQAGQTRITLQADFTDWLCRPCENRAQYSECLALLAQTSKPKPTKPNELADILQSVPTDEQLIIISDSPPDNWIHLVPPTHPQVMVIDIRQIRFRKRRLQLVP